MEASAVSECFLVCVSWIAFFFLVVSMTYNGLRLKVFMSKHSESKKIDFELLSQTWRCLRFQNNSCFGIIFFFLQGRIVHDVQRSETWRCLQFQNNSCLIFFFYRAVVSMTYYGLSLNVSNLSGSVRINFLLSSIVELIGYASAGAVLDRIGRKRYHCAIMIFSGLACLASILPVLYGSQRECLFVRLSVCLSVCLFIYL